MVKFCDTAACNSELIQIIKNAEQKLNIISPYIKITPQIQKYLEYTDDKKVPITIIYRHDKGTNPIPNNQFLQNLKHLNLLMCQNLHTKCYTNESTSLITSMNLYDHSIAQNFEMGILITNHEDPIIYNEIAKETDQILYHSQPHPTKSIIKQIFNLKLKSSQNAYCIRCGKQTNAINPKKPYCPTCFHIWLKYQNPQHIEKYCHICGENHPTSLNKPLCYHCYQTTQH